MAKEKKEEAPKESKSERQARWDAFLAAYEKSNPEKFAARMKAGQLNMPDSFV